MQTKKMPKKYRNYALLGLIAVLIIAFYMLSSDQQNKPTEIKYSEFYSKLIQGEVKNLKIVEKDITGQIGLERFHTYIPYEHPELIDILLKNNISFSGAKKEEHIIWQGIIAFIPYLLIFGVIWFLMFRQMQGGSKAMSFGKSRARLHGKNDKKVTFNDVAGCDEAKEELEEVIDFLKKPKKFIDLGARIPKGVLLVGPPGTGKTLLARAVAGEAGVPFFSISGSDFVEMFVGVGASRVRDLFEQGKKNSPCIIFIDEIDAVGRHRGAGLGGGHDEREQTLNQLLVEMDGFSTNQGIIMIAATNRPDILDPALLRPGRFDRQVVVDYPDIKGRKGILEVHSKDVPLSKNVDLDILARGTPGFTGADLENMINEAALLTARSDKKKVSMEELEEAKDKVLMGPERKSMVISAEEKRNTAYHESGHVLASKLLKNTDPVHKVTIIPRGRALGLTQQLPLDERLTKTKDYWQDEIVVFLAGRVAEEYKFGTLSTGAGNDIDRATNIARNMVCKWGMSKLGPVTFGSQKENIFLGREITQHKDYSEHTAMAIDQEIMRIINESYSTAKMLISKNKNKLEKLATALIEKEILTSDEIDHILKIKTKDKISKKSKKTIKASKNKTKKSS